jgi:hypothetical protein
MDWEHGRVDFLGNPRQVDNFRRVDVREGLRGEWNPAPNRGRGKGGRGGDQGTGTRSTRPRDQLPHGVALQIAVILSGDVTFASAALGHLQATVG